MKRLLPSLGASVLSLLLVGCLTTPESQSGGMGSVPVMNSNVDAILTAAQSVFAQAGYTAGTTAYPESITFDKPATGFAKAMWGGFNQTTTIRVRLSIVEMAQGNSYRLSTRVYTVSNAGEAGFEDQHALSGLWSGEFEPLLKKIAAQASGAGPG